MKKAILLAVLLAAVLIFGYHNYQPNESDSPMSRVSLDPDLRDADITIAILYFQLEQSLQSICAASEGLAGTGGNHPVVVEMIREYEGKCLLLRKAKKESEPAFQSVRESRAIVGDYFVFSVFDRSHNHDDGFEEKEVGVFPSISSCREVEQIARHYLLPTRSCRQWLSLEQRIAARTGLE